MLSFKNDSIHSLRTLFKRGSVQKLLFLAIAHILCLNLSNGQNLLGISKQKISLEVLLEYQFGALSRIAQSHTGIHYSSIDYYDGPRLEYGLLLEHKLGSRLSVYLKTSYSYQNASLKIVTPRFTLPEESFPVFSYDVNRPFVNTSLGLSAAFKRHVVRVGYVRMNALDEVSDVAPGRVNILSDLFFNPTTNSLEGGAIGTQWTIQYARGGGPNSGIEVMYGYNIFPFANLSVSSKANFWGNDLFFFWASEGNVPGYPDNMPIDRFEISNRFLFWSLSIKVRL